MESERQVYRSAILHFLGEPSSSDDYQYWPDGVLIVADGRVVDVGPADALLPKLSPARAIERFPQGLILPGLIDTHTHYPQLGMIASYGSQLLDWLNQYTFASERRFADATLAEAEANRFLDELARNGVTTAMVYGTVHPQSVDGFFRAAEQRGMAMICGKVMMDRNAPADLCDTAPASEQAVHALIDRWHGQGRLRYALTPRFAPTSSPDQLSAVGRLHRLFPDVYLQSHLSESVQEIAWVKELFPWAHDYLDVYEAYGLVSRRSIYGHGIHLSEWELERMAKAGAGIAFCPSSNLFLGSGLFDLRQAEAAGIRVSLATDVGAGTSPSMLQTLADAYKVCQLKGYSLSPLKAFYMATLGNAKALDLDGEIGSFQSGRHADFVVLNPCGSPLLKLRAERAETLQEKLFALMMLGDDRAVTATFSGGRCLYRAAPAA